MSDADEREGIEPGKRLIRVADPSGASLAGRLAATLQRWTWRTPLHAMRLRGRHPLKLIAVPDDPILGDPRRGHALMEGTLAFRGERHRVDALDWARPGRTAAFGDYCHSFAWLRDLSTVATRADAAPVAEALMAGWLAAHGERVDAAWRPDLWGRRILHWTAHAPLILSSADLVYRSRVLNTLARGSRHLDRSADKAAEGTPRIAAWCGLIAAGLLIPGGEARQAAGEAGLARALATGITPDGGTLSRSPADLVDAIALLAALRECYRARQRELPAAAALAIERAAGALAGVLHADGGLPSWQGAAPLPADTVAGIVAAAGVEPRPLRQGREWGYQRLEAGTAVLLVDAAPPPVGRAVASGCASTLAFELSDGPARIVVNCGGAGQAVAALPPAVAQGLRSTAAHSTLSVGDTNSSALHPDGTIGRGVGEVELARQESEAGPRIDAAHDGYVRRFGVRHRRQLHLSTDGRELRGEDALVPAGRPRGPSGFVIRFHLGAGVEASPTADGMAALLRLPGGALWQFRCRGGALGIEESLWIDGDGRPVATQQLVVSGEAPPTGATVTWTFKRAI